jgi:hypothetical protein
VGGGRCDAMQCALKRTPESASRARSSTCTSARPDRSLAAAGLTWSRARGPIATAWRRPHRLARVQFRACHAGATNSWLCSGFS